MATLSFAKIRKLLGLRPLTFVGHNASGKPIGDDSGYRTVEAVEDLRDPNKHDPLVEVTGLLVLSLYLGTFTDDPRQFARLPILILLRKYNEALEKFGLKLRVRDVFRPYTVQQQGFKWGIEQTLKNNDETLEKFLGTLAKVFTTGVTDSEKSWLLKRVDEGDLFFSYVKATAETYEKYSGIHADLVTAAINFGIVDGELDKYAPTAHGSGAVFDIDWIVIATGRTLNVGVAVDHVGIESAFPFFETLIATGIRADLKAKGLLTVKARKAYYRERVATNPGLQQFLSESGVDIDRLATDDLYFEKMWSEIRANRRVVAHVAETFGIVFYVGEGWHADGDNRYGGIAVKDGLVSGGGTMAVYRGQKVCAYGCATSLWENLLAWERLGKEIPTIA